MGRPQTAKEISGAKLKKELAKKDVSLASASVAIGHSEGYLSNVISTGLMPIATALLLEHTFGINPEAIFLPEDEEPEKEVAPVIPPKIEVTYDRQDLYSLVYNAMKNALEEVLGK